MTPTPTPEAEDLLAEGVFTIAEAVAFARVSRAELYRRMDAGHLPHVIRGRRRLIPRRGLVAWLAAGLQGNRPAA